MKSKRYSFPVAMLLKKFYCHECGEKLERSPKTRTIKCGDPDYREYSTYLDGKHLIGDVELTEYDFICQSCRKVISFDDQCVIEKIQKTLDKRVLSKVEVLENIEKAKAVLDKKRKVSNAIVFSIFILITILAIFLAFKFGGFSFKIKL